MLRALDKLLAPIKRRIAMLISRGVVKLVNDSLKLQGVQIAAFADETLDDLERFQQYGLTSHPLPGAEAIVVSLGGTRSHSVVVAVDDRRFRLKNLAPGEVAMYSDEGDTIVLRRGRNIEVTAGTKVKVTSPIAEVIASTKVLLTTPVVECSADLTVGGIATVAGQIVGQGGLAVSGGSGATVAGDVAVTGGNVTADGIGLKTHVHGGVAAGTATTGAPQ